MPSGMLNRPVASPEMMFGTKPVRCGCVSVATIIHPCQTFNGGGFGYDRYSDQTPVSLICLFHMQMSLSLTTGRCVGRSLGDLLLRQDFLHCSHIYTMELCFQLLFFFLIGILEEDQCRTEQDSENASYVGIM